MSYFHIGLPIQKGPERFDAKIRHHPTSLGGGCFRIRLSGHRSRWGRSYKRGRFGSDAKWVWITTRDPLNTAAPIVAAEGIAALLAP
jgi:hypothetical protein